MNIDNQKDYWDSIANIKTFTHPINLSLLSKYIDISDSIIDFGCGYGRLVKLLIDFNYKNIIGYDTSLDLIKRGLKDNIPIHYIDNPADLPVDNNSVDCILLFAVLTCIPSNKGQRDLINILYSKLKTDGIIYISDYYLQDNPSEVNRYDYFNDDKNNFGTFRLPEGAMFRHHTKKMDC